MSYPYFIHTLSIPYPSIVHSSSLSTLYPWLVQQKYTTSIIYPCIIYKSSIVYQLDKVWINLGYYQSNICPSFVQIFLVTYPQFIQVQALSRFCPQGTFNSTPVFYPMFILSTFLIHTSSRVNPDPKFIHSLSKSIHYPNFIQIQTLSKFCPTPVPPMAHCPPGTQLDKIWIKFGFDKSNPQFIQILTLSKFCPTPGWPMAHRPPGTQLDKIWIKFGFR